MIKRNVKKNLWILKSYDIRFYDVWFWQVESVSVICWGIRKLFGRAVLLLPESPFCLVWMEKKQLDLRDILQSQGLEFLSGSSLDDFESLLICDTPWFLIFAWTESNVDSSS